MSRIWLAGWLVLLLLTPSVLAGEPKTLLLLGQSPDGHPPQTHEYKAGLEVLAKLLAPLPDVQVQIVNADEPWADGPELLTSADGAVLFLAEGAKWIQTDPRRYQAFAQFASRGGGLSVLHWGMGTPRPNRSNDSSSCSALATAARTASIRLSIPKLRVVDAAHAATSGLADFRVRDEFYYRLKRVVPETGLHPLVQAVIDGQPQMVAWAYDRPDGGRSFGFSGLHFHANWQSPRVSHAGEARRAMDDEAAE